MWERYTLPGPTDVADNLSVLALTANEAAKTASCSCTAIGTCIVFREGREGHHLSALSERPSVLSHLILLHPVLVLSCFSRAHEVKEDGAF